MHSVVLFIFIDTLKLVVYFLLTGTLKAQCSYIRRLEKPFYSTFEAVYALPGKHTHTHKINREEQVDSGEEDTPSELLFITNFDSFRSIFVRPDILTLTLLTSK